MDENGMDAHGNYRTMAQRTEAMRQQVQENQEHIDEEYQVDVMHAAGISSYGNGTKEEVAQQAFQVLDKAASNQNEPGSYDYTAGTDVAAAAQRVAQGSENYKEETAKNAEEVQFAFMGSTTQQMNHSDDIAGTVENPSSNQTLSYYRDDRNTLEKNTATQGVAGAIAKYTHGEYQDALEEALYYGKKMREEINLKDNGYKDYDTWLSNVNTYSRLRDEALDRVIKAGGDVEQIKKDHPEFAKALEKYK
jgi:hypothetical protein